MDNNRNLFIHYETKKKANGTIVKKYKVNSDYEIFIDSINIETGLCSKKRILEYSEHLGLELYRFKHKEFDFWASSDHSLIVYDLREDKIKILSPKQILNDNRHKLFLIKKDSNEDDHFKRCSKLIPLSEVDIYLDKEKTDAYDFTVEDNYTFMLSSGVFVQDTYSVYALLTLEAQQDAKKFMMKPIPAKKYGEFLWDLKQDIQLGIYLLTRDVSPNDFLLKGHKQKHLGKFTYEQLRENYKIGVQEGYHIYDKIDFVLDKNRVIKDITLGRGIFNSYFPKEFLIKNFKGLIDFPVSKKSLPKITLSLIDDGYTQDEMSEIVDNLKTVGFFYSTVFPIGLLINEFLVTEKFKQMKKEYKEAKSFEKKQKILEKIDDYLKKNIAKDIPMISILVNSGARGNVNQIRQLFLTKGIVQDSLGNIKDIPDNFLDGFDVKEYFNAGNVARKGMMDRALNTATTGYLMRKLIYACSSVKLSNNVRDCKTKRTLRVKITDSNKDLLLMRYIVNEKTGEYVLLTPKIIKEFIGKEVQLRSPIFCKSRDICHICAGEFSKKIHTEYIGIVAGDTLGERGTQEIMKTFHTGGSASVSVPDFFKIAKVNNPKINIKVLDEYFEQKQKFIKFKKYPSSSFLIVPLDMYSGIFTKKDFTEVFQPARSNLSVEEKGQLYLRFPYLSSYIVVNRKDVLEDLIIDTPLRIPFNSILSMKIEQEFNIANINFQNVFVIEFHPKQAYNNYVFELELASQDLNNLMTIILGMIERRNKLIKYPETLFYKLEEIYGSFKVAYLYIEILVSQLFRCSSDESLPYRLCADNPSSKPVLVGIKNVPVLESWLSGLLFENAQKSIESGLFSETNFSNPFESLITSKII